MSLRLTDSAANRIETRYRGSPPASLSLGRLYTGSTPGYTPIELLYDDLDALGTPQSPPLVSDIDAVAALIHRLSVSEGRRLLVSLGPPQAGDRALLLAVEADNLPPPGAGAYVLENLLGTLAQERLGAVGPGARFEAQIHPGAPLANYDATLVLSGESALAFSGTGLHEIDVGHIPIGGRRYTVEAWIRLTGPRGGGGIVGRHQTTGDAQGTLDVFEGRLRFLVNTRDGHHDLRSPFALPQFEWTHVAGVYDGATMRIYVNSREVAYRAVEGPFANSNPGNTRLGGYAGSARIASYWFSGELDEIRLWSVDRTPEQLKDAMLLPLEPQAGLEGYWRFNESGGHTVRDHSGHGRHGQLSNRSGTGLPRWVPGVFSQVRLP